MKPSLSLIFVLIFPSAVLAGNSKVEFEQRNSVLVWDEGKLRGYVDSGDDLTDVTVPCSFDDNSEPFKISSDRPQNSPAKVKQVANKLLTSIGIQTKLAMNPILAFEGDPKEPIFFLFPEVHIQESPSASTILLHESRAADMLQVTNDLVKNNIRVLNFDEGPKGVPWEKSLGIPPTDSAEKLKWALGALNSYSMSGAVLVGEAFSPKVETAFDDDNDLWLRWVLTTFALNHQSWNEVHEALVGSSRVTVSKIKPDDYKSFYNELLQKTADGQRDEYSRLCEARSQQMARFSYDLAKAKNARVVYMSFGTLHAYGIIEQLKRYSASFVVFSPNYDSVR